MSVRGERFWNAVLIAVCCSPIIALLTIAVLGAVKIERKGAACVAAGGVDVRTRSGPVCLKPDAIKLTR